MREEKNFISNLEMEISDFILLFYTLSRPHVAQKPSVLFLFLSNEFGNVIGKQKMVKITFKRNIRFRKYVAFCSAVLHAALQYQSINMADIQSLISLSKHSPLTRPATQPGREEGGAALNIWYGWTGQPTNLVLSAVCATLQPAAWI